MNTLTWRCPSCKEYVQLQRTSSGFRSNHTCPPKGAPTQADKEKGKGEPSRGGNGAPFKRWSSAVRTCCAAQHRHASKMEARVCDRLMIECVAQGHALCQQVRFPLLSICPKMSGRPHTICVDFVVVDGRGTWRAVDAKSKRVSRDWPLRAAAFEATYGRPIAEVEK